MKHALFKVRVFAPVRFLLLVLFLFIQSMAVSAQQKITVACIFPNSEDIPFWRDTAAFMHAVADDLDINLETRFVKSNDISYKRVFDQVVNSERRPEYILMGRWGIISKQLLQEADKKNIKILTFNSNFLLDEHQIIGFPRSKHRNWIAELVTENRNAGYQLAERLIAHVKKMSIKDRDKKITIFGIGAYSDDAVSIERVDGLKQLVAEEASVVLLEVALGGWLRDSAYRLTLDALERHQSIDVIWSVSDEMAMGAIDAARKKGLQAGKDFVIGGFDWKPENISLIRQGEVTASFGGQIFDGGWALIMLYDYHHGIDFAVSGGARVNMPIYEITAENINNYTGILENYDGIDFKSFTKKHNSMLKEYPFSLNALFESKNANSQHAVDKKN
ncbi:MAG: ABC transporter substrate-binding protein [Gammaproteobacteria bacterium]|nr:ABC transporter substrate-binding protein [Gammaproteobacteria bacterium]